MGASCVKNSSSVGPSSSHHSIRNDRCSESEVSFTTAERGRPLFTPSSLTVTSVSQVGSVACSGIAEIIPLGYKRIRDSQESLIEHPYQSGPHIASFQWALRQLEPAAGWTSAAAHSAQFIVMGMKWCLSISVGAVQMHTVVTLELLEDTNGLLAEDKEAGLHIRICIYNTRSPQESITIDARHSFSVGTNWSSNGVIPPISWSSPREGFLESGELVGDLVLLHDERIEGCSRGEGQPSVSCAGLMDFNYRPVCDRSLPHAHLLSSVKVISIHPTVITFEDFLTVAECKHLLHLAQPHLKRSLVSGRTISDNRTSESMFMTGPLEMDPTVQAIERRVMFYVAFFGSRVSLEREKLQVIRYKVGQEFKPHFDNEAGDCSKRAVTMLMFLTDVAEGGETYFPKAIPLGRTDNKVQGLAVRPKQGRALVFWSRRPNGGEDPLSLHGGSKVLKGEKWLASKWVTLR